MLSSPPPSEAFGKSSEQIQMSSVKYGFSDAVKLAYKRHPNPKIIYGDSFLDHLEFTVEEGLAPEEKDAFALKKVAALQEHHLVKYRALLKQRGLLDAEAKSVQNAPNYTASLYRITDGKKESLKDWVFGRDYSDFEILSGATVTRSARFDESSRKQDERYGRFVLFALIVLCVTVVTVQKLI
jgi:hypothetical protein